MTTFPFGKHQGRSLTVIPGDYLAWCLRELADLRPPWRRAIEAELERRKGEREAEQRRRQAEEAVRLAGAWLEGRGRCGCKECSERVDRALANILAVRGVPRAMVDLSNADIKILGASCE